MYKHPAETYLYINVRNLATIVITQNASKYLIEFVFPVKYIGVSHVEFAGQ